MSHGQSRRSCRPRRSPVRLELDVATRRGMFFGPIRSDPIPMRPGSTAGSMSPAAKASRFVPAAGVVSFAGSVPGSGRTVTIQVGGYAVSVTHLASDHDQQGSDDRRGRSDRRRRTDGDSEWASPYVHLGIRTSAAADGYVDPMTLLPPRAVAPSAAGEPSPLPRARSLAPTQPARGRESRVDARPAIARRARRSLLPPLRGHLASEPARRAVAHDAAAHAALRPSRTAGALRSGRRRAARLRGDAVLRRAFRSGSPVRSPPAGGRRSRTPASVPRSAVDSRVARPSIPSG